MTLTLSLGMGGILFSVSPNDGMITYLMIYGRGGGGVLPCMAV